MGTLSPYTGLPVISSKGKRDNTFEPVWPSKFYMSAAGPPALRTEARSLRDCFSSAAMENVSVRMQISFYLCLTPFANTKPRA